MKFFSSFFLFAVLLLANQVNAANPTLPTPKVDEPKDELSKLDQLIQATEESLRREKALRELMVQYKEAEIAAIKNPDDTENLLKMVHLAKQVRDGIAGAYLDDYFSPQFLEELKKLSDIAERKNVPPPK